MASGARWTLDIAHVVDGRVIRRHLTRLTGGSVVETLLAERIMPGRVYSEKSRHKPGDPSWVTEWRVA
jgi:hypothetical protein